MILPPSFTPYFLPPDKLVQAIQLSRIYDVTDFCGPIWSTVALLVTLRLHVYSRLRDWVQSITARWWLQGLIFIPAFIFILTLILLPPEILVHYAKLVYGLSIQPWPSWAADQTKSLLPSLVLGTPVFLLGFLLIARSPKRWWLWFWLLTLPVLVFMQFVRPVLIAPMYDKFEPLSKSNPALVDKMEQVIAKSNLKISPSQIYVMNGSAKSTVLNAYVTGLGASRRVVIYDSLIARATTDQVLFIFAHELGHSAFNHIFKGLAFGAALLLVQLFLARLCAIWLIARFGQKWKIPAINDWAAAAVLALIFVTFNFLSEPVEHSFQRLLEHHADIYGMEAVHGLIANPQQSASDFEQISGENTLEPPHENPFVIFWTYTHPSAPERKQFEATYDPWQPGQHPRYFPEETAK
jgi:STE24 endopeptidase